MADIELNKDHTLIEVAKAHGPDGSLLKLVDVLSKNNPILEEGYWVEANDFTTHTFTQILTEPTGTHSRINKGVPYESAQSKQVKEDLIGLESYSRIDERILMRIRNAEKYRSDRDQAHLRGMAKTFHSDFLYGNRKNDPDNINGLATRYSAANGANIKTAGGSGDDTTSVWVIKWGEDGVFLTYPRGFKRFIDMIDLKRQLVHDGDGNPYTALVTHFIINFGLCVADDRCVQRIANIESAGSSNLFDEDYLITVLNRMPNRDGVVIYCNSTVKTQMDIALKDKQNVNYSMDKAWGFPTLNFQGIPVRQLDAITNTETALA